MRDDAFFLCFGDVARNSIGIQACHIDVEAFAGLQHLADDQSNDECDCRNHLKIKQCFHANAADFFEVAHRTDPVHDRAKDDRADHHLDE